MLRAMVFYLVLLIGASVARADATYDCDHAKDIERKIRGCTALLRRNPHDEVAYYNRGKAYAKKGDYDAAIASFTRAIQIVGRSPKSAEAYNERGLAYEGKGDYDAAISDYNQAIRINPSDAFAYNNRGVAHKLNGDDDSAIADYTQAIRIEPNDAVAYYNRANAYSKKGDYDAAIADYTKTIRIKPNNASAYFGRGIAYFGEGDYDAAIADYTKATQIQPNYADAYYNRGNAYYKKGDYDAATEDYTNYIQIKPNDADGYRRRAKAYAMALKPEKGLPDAERALKLQPDDAFALETRGGIFWGLGRREEAIADFRQALSKNPDLLESKNALETLEAPAPPSPSPEVSAGPTPPSLVADAGPSTATLPSPSPEPAAVPAPATPSPSPETSAGAASAAELEACTKAPDHVAALAACTRLIDSGKLTGNELAAANEARGRAEEAAEIEELEEKLIDRGLVKPSGEELLKQVCEDTPAGDRCQIASNYPFASENCSIELSGARMEGKYVEPSGDSDGTVLVVGYLSSCVAGSLLFEKTNTGYVFRGYEEHVPAFDLSKCVNVEQTQRDRLLCIGRETADGWTTSHLWAMNFVRASDKPLLMLNPDEVLRALNIAGVNRIYCSSKMDIFGFDDLRSGPTDNIALVRVSYIDEPEIGKACTSAARLSTDVTPDLKTGQALIADTSLRNEYFAVDLRKRGQLVSQRSGETFDFNWSDAP